MHEFMFEKIELFPGAPHPLGFSIQGDKVNFALFSSHAAQVILALFNGIETREVPMQKTLNIWHIALKGLPQGTEYALRAEGPHEPKEGLLYQGNRYLADPYAKIPATRAKWGEGMGSVRSRCIEPAPFDWQKVPAPQIPKEDLIIYEMHTRGFTQHPSSHVSHPGTFLGIIEKIPYLKKLGVNAIELMPIFEFDEMHHLKKINYWGYSPLFFFAPMRRFAHSDPLLEIKTLVRELHRNGIEIFLDVVYNHTGESKDLDYYVNFRGLDNSVYYMVDPSGQYLDFSGCFNTFNVNHPDVAELILNSLSYWRKEVQIDGFRFDLASIFTRGCDGQPIKNPPLLEKIESDPRLQGVKWIAEAWDAAGLYQLGLFAQRKQWSEWNGLFRDRTRRFIKGTDGTAGPFADVLCGSQFLYSSTSPLSSINFITAHDGFTLRDLVSYQQKRNMDNGEMNRDGNDQNDNWNCGFEGETADPPINALRERQMRNFLLSLFLAQGIPMLKMGDEYGHSSKGNNNPYVQDNEISWFLWDVLEKQGPIFDFAASLISFRKNHPSLRFSRFLTDQEIEWHGANQEAPDWSSASRFISYTLKAPSPLYIAFNANYLPQRIHLPGGISWKEVVRTENPWDQHHLKDPEKGDLISSIELVPYSALLAKGSGVKENRLIH
jgi:isoamylase